MNRTRTRIGAYAYEATTLPVITSYNKSGHITNPVI